MVTKACGVGGFTDELLQAFNDHGAANNDLAVTLYNVHADQIDTPRIITKQDHTIVWRWDTAEAFGGTVPNQNPSGLGNFVYNQRFPGQVFDARRG